MAGTALEYSGKAGGDMTLEEIKLRRLAGQHLTDKSDAATVLHDLCGIQAQMMSYAEHSAYAALMRQGI